MPTGIEAVAAISCDVGSCGSGAEVNGNVIGNSNSVVNGNVNGGDSKIYSNCTNGVKSDSSKSKSIDSADESNSTKINLLDGVQNTYNNIHSICQIGVDGDSVETRRLSSSVVTDNNVGNAHGTFEMRTSAKEGLPENGDHEIVSNDDIRRMNRASASRGSSSSSSSSPSAAENIRISGGFHSYTATVLHRIKILSLLHYAKEL